MFSQLRYVQERLEKLTFAQLREVASSSDVPFGTVRRVASKATLNPRSQTTDKLASYFKTRELRSK